MKIEKATKFGADALEWVSAIQGLMFVFLGGLSILLIDVLVGALGWSGVLSPGEIVEGAKTFTLLGWNIDKDVVAGMLEMGPDAFVGLIIMLAARKVQDQAKANKKFLSQATDWVLIVGLVFGIVVYVSDGVKDGIFGYVFLYPLINAFTTIEWARQGLLWLGVGLIVACSLMGNIAVIGLIQYAKVLNNDVDEPPAPAATTPATPVATPAATPAATPEAPQAAQPPAPPMNRMPGGQPALRPPMPGGPQHRPPTPRGRG